MQLDKQDVAWVLRRCPDVVCKILMEHPGKLFLAGGFIRSCISKEPINDVDLFCGSKEFALGVAGSLYQKIKDASVIDTDNALTVLGEKLPIQFIHRWVFETPQQCIESFDFTVASAAIWHNGEAWESVCDERYYADLAAKRLTYRNPIREEEAGGSMLRVLKFARQGYTIPIDDLSAVMERVVDSLSSEHGATKREQIRFRLREVDPLFDPYHLGH